MTKHAHGHEFETVPLPRPVAEDPEMPEKQASAFRVALPQVLASTAKNMLLLDLGLTIAFPTIAIGALRNATEGLSLDDEQASWFGSIAFICQPLGSILSGMLMEPIGRKRSMLLVNFPHILGWFLFYSANSVTTLYVTAVIMGLGVGFMEAPILTYVGEISQPHLRGILTSYAAIFVQLGFFIEYLLGTITDWRTAAAISAGVPILTVLAITQVPETPMWLLSKGRMKEAEEALCWLRGWVKPAAVREEFQELVRYSKEINKKNNLKKQKAGGVQSEESLVANEDTFIKKLKELRKGQTLWPLLLVICFFFFQNSSGLPGIRPYLVQVFEEFGVPLDPHWSTVVFALLGIVGNVACMGLVKWTGKKPLSLFSLGLSAACCLSLGIYALNLITPGHRNPDQVATWIPLTLFVLMSFVYNVGLGPIPWMLLSEIFPFKTRGFASGIAAAASYVLGFVVSKTFLGLKNNLHLHGVFLLYGAVGCVGCGFLYRFLKETEGKSLEAIEDDFKRKNKNTDAAAVKGVVNEGLQVSTLDLTGTCKAVKGGGMKGVVTEGLQVSTPDLTGTCKAVGGGGMKGVVNEGQQVSTPDLTGTCKAVESGVMKAVEGEVDLTDTCKDQQVRDTVQLIDEAVRQSETDKIDASAEETREETKTDEIKRD